MRSFLIFVGMVACTGGCTHAQLRQSTLKQAETLTDLQYQQVLNNLAMLAANPGSLPFFARSETGNATVSDTGGASVGLEWDPFGLVGETLGLEASRQNQQSWDLTSVLDPTRLELMRCAYVLALGQQTDECQCCIKKLADFFGPDFVPDCHIPQGWFAVGCKKDVPKDACYVGRYCKTYIWVVPDGVVGLTRLTQTILSIAVNEPYAPTMVQVERLFKNGQPKPYETRIISQEPVAQHAPEAATVPSPLMRMRPADRFLFTPPGPRYLLPAPGIQRR